MELREIMKKVKKSLLVLTSLGMVSGVYANELSHLNVVHAVKNHDGVCEIETKSGEFSFTANGKEITTTKPMDLIQIIDLSGSLSDSEYKQRNGVEGARKQQINDMIYTIRTQLTDQDHVMLAFYGTNSVDSYAVEGQDGGVATRLLTKTEAINILTQINNEEQVHRVSQSWELIPKVVKPLLDGYLADSAPGAGFEDVYMSQPNRNKVVSVLQFTDDWVGSEDIDSSFAAWAKANAKTFMTVVDNAQADSSTSTERMKAVGHPNIKVFRRLDEPNRQETIANLFKSTATEKVQPKTTINVTPEQGLTLKEVKLVSPDGKEENLAITNNRVNVEKDLPQDGKWTVKVKAEGLVPETRKVTSTATIGGKEVGKTELVFEGCKDDVKGTKEEKENVDIPFETKYEDTEDLPAGETKVKREGVVGIKEIKRVWKTVNGIKQGDPTVTESIIKPKVDKIILRGTQKKKTVYYRIVDPSDKVLKDNTKVSDGYKGAKYTVTKPTLAGYEIELKPGMKESGTLEGRDVIVDYVAYKLGKGVNARFVDEDGKELKAGVKVKDAGLRNGTKYGITPEPVLEKDGLKYIYKELKQGSAPASGEVSDNEQVVTFVYKKAEGSAVKARYLLKGTNNSLEAETVIKPRGTQIGTPWVSTHKNEIVKDGLVYVIDSKLPVESGKVTETEQIITYNYVPKVGGQVKARYINKDTVTSLIDDLIIKPKGTQVGTPWVSTHKDELVKDGLAYIIDGVLPTETGKVTDMDKVLTYNYAPKLGKGVSVRYVYGNEDLKSKLVLVKDGMQVGTGWKSSRELEIEKDGLLYELDTKNLPNEVGQITTNLQEVVYKYIPKLGKSVHAEFVKKDTADKLIDDLIIKPDGTQVGTPWTSSHKNELMKDGLVYAIDGTLPVELGKVTEKEQVLKYNYVPKLGQPVRVRYVADNVEISGMEVVSENAQVGSGYEKEVAHEIKKDGKLYRFVGLEKAEEGTKPKTDEPKVDAPKGDEPKVDTPKGNEPKGEKPTDGKPTDGKPAGVKPNEDSKPKDGEAPKADTPKADAPKVDEPKATDGDVIEVDSKSEIKDRQFKGIVNNHEQVYVAKYVEVKLAPVKVNFVDENGKELKAGINLLKADTLLDSDYKYDAEKRIKVGDDEYVLVGVTLDGKDVKEIKGKFGEKEQVYTAKYKKVVKPAPAKLPKTSGVEGYAKTQVATGLTVMGILGLVLSFFGYRRKVNK